MSASATTNVTTAPGVLSPGAISVPRPDLMSALPDLTLGLVFLLTWMAPGMLHVDLERTLITALLLEFIVIHSSAFLGSVIISAGPRGGRASVVLGVSLFYTLFAGAISLSMHSWGPLLGFWGLTFNRLAGVTFGQAPTGGEREFLKRGWVVSLACYIGFTMLTVKLPIPHLGLTPDVLAGMPHLQVRGLWVEEPWRAMAFGFLYFTTVGIFELREGRPARI